MSPDGSSIVIDSQAIYVDGKTVRPGRITAYDTATGDQLFATRPHGSLGAVWSPDGTVFALGAGARSVRILDRSGREVRVLQEEDLVDDRVRAAVFSPDGRYLATSVRVRGGTAEDGLVRIWDWRRHVVVREIETGLGEVAFDRTGARLVTFDGNVVETWDVRTGARLAEEPAGNAPAPVWDVAIAPDGSLIAIAFRNGTIELLDPTTGEQVILRGHIATALSFSPDGRTLASVGVGLVGDGVRIWALDIDDLLEIARRRSPGSSPTRNASSSCVSIAVRRREAAGERAVDRLDEIGGQERTEHVRRVQEFGHRIPGIDRGREVGLT